MSDKIENAALFKPFYEDPEGFFTTEETLNNIEPFDSATYIVGVVATFDSNDKERVVNRATNQTSTVFNFSLEGKDGIPIHFCCWKENLQLLEGKIILKNVLLIDGAFARPIKSSFTQDNGRFQLTIRPNTRVFVLRDSSPDNELLPAFNEAVFYKSFQEILSLKIDQEKVPVGMNVWIRQALRMKDASVAVCVVRDEQHFAKYCVTGFNPNSESNPKVGDKVKIVAFASFTSNGVLQLEGQFDKIKKIEADDKAYLSLKPAASPGKRLKVE